jgi:hypothetical protein
MIEIRAISLIDFMVLLEAFFVELDSTHRCREKGRCRKRKLNDMHNFVVQEFGE